VSEFQKYRKEGGRMMFAVFTKNAIMAAKGTKLNISSGMTSDDPASPGNAF
jgi:hypothetical protein